MNTPDKCPKCGAGLDPEFRAPWWICGSHKVGGRFVQAFECKHIARADHAERQRDALAARVKRLEFALENIRDYWNRHNNERSMEDALWHAIDTAAEALEQKEAKP